MSTYYNPQKRSTRSDYLDCPGMAVEFLHYLESIRGLSPASVNAYYIDLRLFFKYLKLKRGLVPPDTVLETIKIDDISIDFVSEITKSEIYEFLYYLTRTRDNSSAARARKLSSLRGFFKYLTSKTAQLEHNPTDDVESPKIKKSLPRHLSLDESHALLENVESDFYARDYCIITLFLNCGMRLSELVAINVADIKQDTLRVVGKGNKERMVYLNEACVSAVQTLLTERASLTNLKDKNALFVSKRTGNRLSSRRVQQIVEGSLRLAELDGKGYSTHKLRHTAATLLYRYGNVDLLALKEILGHVELSTTQIYTHLDSAQLREAAHASPLAGVQPSKKKTDKKSPENE